MGITLAADTRTTVHGDDPTGAFLAAPAGAAALLESPERSMRSPRSLRHRGVGEHGHPPGMDVLHAAGQLLGQVPAGQVDV